MLFAHPVFIKNRVCGVKTPKNIGMTIIALLKQEYDIQFVVWIFERQTSRIEPSSKNSHQGVRCYLIASLTTPALIASS